MDDLTAHQQHGAELACADPDEGAIPIIIPSHLWGFFAQVIISIDQCQVSDRGDSPGAVFLDQQGDVDRRGRRDPGPIFRVFDAGTGGDDAQ